MAAYELSEKGLEVVVEIHPQDIIDGHIGIYIPLIREVVAPYGLDACDVIARLLKTGMNRLQIKSGRFLGTNSARPGVNTDLYQEVEALNYG